MANHLSDVASTDQHTVKPWFNGKLDYAPPVQDYSGLGFPLTGGRIDYIDHRAVAALVYRHKEHVINAFVWPASRANSGLRSATRQGFNMIEWDFEGMRYWLVSDLSMEELEKFAQITQSPPIFSLAPKN
jgi:anti-sigma factor RsiW